MGYYLLSYIVAMDFSYTDQIHAKAGMGLNERMENL